MAFFRPSWSGGGGYNGPTVEDAVVWVWRWLCRQARAYKAQRDAELEPYRRAHAERKRAAIYQISGNKGIDKGASE